MENLFRILQTALPVLAALALGVLCRKLNFLTRDGVDTLKKVVVNLTLPAVVFAAFATAEYSLQTIAIPVLVFLLCCAGLGLGKVLARLLRLPGRVTPYLAGGFEAGMLGYALFALLFPQASSARFAILDLGQTLFVFTLYKALLSGGKETKSLWKDIVNTPILWGAFAGLLVGATGLFAWMTRNGSAAVVTSLTDFLSAPTGMMILLAVGYDLDFAQIRWRETARFVVLRLRHGHSLRRAAAGQPDAAPRHHLRGRGPAALYPAAALRPPHLRRRAQPAGPDLLSPLGPDRGHAAPLRSDDRGDVKPLRTPHNCVCGLRPIFCPIRAAIKGGEIHTVFPPFYNFRMRQNLWPNALAKLCGDALV